MSPCKGDNLLRGGSLSFEVKCPGRTVCFEVKCPGDSLLRSNLPSGHFTSGGKLLRDRTRQHAPNSEYAPNSDVRLITRVYGMQYLNNYAALNVTKQVHVHLHYVMSMLFAPTLMAALAACAATVTLGMECYVYRYKITCLL